MKANEIQKVQVRSTSRQGPMIPEGPKDAAVVYVDAERNFPTTGTLFLRLHITYFSNGRTKDKLQWADAESGAAWSDFSDGGKVIIAEFGKDDDTAVRVIGKAFVLQADGTSAIVDVETFIQDWEVDGMRKPDVAAARGASIEIKTGKFDLVAPGLAAYHDVNFNVVVKLGTSFFVFDPLVILVPRRP
jgi:hypothetical protein